MTPDAHQLEHDVDPPDMADSYVLLDDGQVRFAVCEGCGQTICVCCTKCGTSPCRCEPPFSQREIRVMYARFDAGPERYRP